MYFDDIAGTGDHTEASGRLGRGAIQHAAERQPVDGGRCRAVTAFDVVSACRGLFRVHDLHQSTTGTRLYLC